MPSTYSSSLRLELMAQGENANTWGNKTNTNLDKVEQAIAGYQSVNIAGNSSVYLSVVNASATSDSPGRNAFIVLTGALTSAISVIVPDAAKGYWVLNNATGASVTFRTSGGTGFNLPGGRWVFAISNGTTVVDTIPTGGYAYLTSVNTFTNLNTFTSALTVNTSVSVSGSMVVTGQTDLRGSVSVSGTSTFRGPVVVSGASTFTSAVTFNTSVSINNSLLVSGQTTLRGSVIVSGAAVFSSAVDVSATTTFYDKEVVRPLFKDYALVANALASVSASVSIDLTLGNYISAYVAGSTSFLFVNPPASPAAGGFILELTNGGAHTVVWPSTVNWSEGIVPVLTPGGVDILTFLTDNGGTDWYGVFSLQDGR